MVDTLVKIGSFVIDLFKTRSERADYRKEQISDVLEQISYLLEDLYVDLMRDEYPHGKCAEMDLLYSNLFEALKDDLDEEYLLLLKQNMNSAMEIEKLYGVRDQPEQVEKIKVASGYFKAAAILALI